MKQKYVCYSCDCESEECESGITFTTPKNASYLLSHGFKLGKLLYEIEALTWEEAMTEHHRRQGYEEYVPICYDECEEE